MDKWLNEIETRVAEIWTDVLGIPEVNRTDSFLEIGGDSISAMRLAASLTAEFDVAIPIELVLANVTVPEMASTIESHRPETTDTRSGPGTTADSTARETGSPTLEPDSVA